jgi:hypothetical protein
MAMKLAESLKASSPASSEDSDEEAKSLLGLDAKIPGGRFDNDTGTKNYF